MSYYQGEARLCGVEGRYRETVTKLAFCLRWVGHNHDKPTKQNENFV